MKKLFLILGLLLCFTTCSFARSHDSGMRPPGGINPPPVHHVGPAGHNMHYNHPPKPHHHGLNIIFGGYYSPRPLCYRPCYSNRGGSLFQINIL